jgi:hypothetical protein
MAGESCSHALLLSNSEREPRKFIGRLGGDVVSELIAARQPSAKLRKIA